MLTVFVFDDPQIPSTNDMIPSYIAESLEILESPTPSSIMLTCEHASNKLPPPYCWQSERPGLEQSHWAWDPGAADITRALAKAIHAPALLSKWSRLWIDLNRPVDSPTMFRSVADGAPILLNNNLSESDANARIAHAYTPYHATLQRLITSIKPSLGFSTHTFTPCYEGTVRDVEIGILFDSAEAAGQVLIDSFTRAGFITKANEPWSGKSGMMFAISDATYDKNAVALEIEVRQDIATDPTARARVVSVLSKALPYIANYHTNHR